MKEGLFGRKAEVLEFQKDAAYQEFEKSAGRILRTSQDSQQRIALRDWLGLLEAHSKVAYMQAAVDVAKESGRQDDLALVDDLVDAKTRLAEADKLLTQRAKQYRLNLIAYDRKKGEKKRSIYEQTLRHLEYKLYPNLFQVEAEILTSRSGSFFYTQDEINAMAMRNVVEGVQLSIRNIQERETVRPPSRRRRR